MTTRRMFLRAAGASLALPLLPSLLPRTARAAGPIPRRFVVWFNPNGMMMEPFTPDEEGFGYTTPPTLAGLADIKHRFSVVSGLDNQGAIASMGRGCLHSLALGALLSDMPIDSYGGIANGTTVDQHAALLLGQQTPFPSLQLGTGEPQLVCAMNDCTYRGTLSWAPGGVPLPTEDSPRALFDRLFAGSDPEESAEEAAARVAVRRSVLDAVGDRLQAVQSRLGVADRDRLDQYLTGVRELEGRIDLLEEAADACPTPSVPGAIDGLEERLDAMIDLLVVAMQCDLTRVASIMTGPSAGTTVFDFLGLSRDHHTLSHHVDNAEWKADLGLIDAWRVGMLGRLMRRLAEVEYEDGTDLLGHTAVLMVSEFADPNAHSYYQLPVLLGGGSAGGWQQGRHLVVPDQPISNLYLSILDFLGTPEARFGAHGDTPIRLT